MVLLMPKTNMEYHWISWKAALQIYDFFFNHLSLVIWTLVLWEPLNVVYEKEKEKNEEIKYSLVFSP